MTDNIVGFIDIGSNTARLIVVNFTNGDEIIMEDSDVLPIGRSLYSNGVIDDLIIEQSRSILSRFSERAHGVGASRVIAFATCAFRDIGGGKGIADAIPSDIDLRIISGQEEAAITRLGIFGTDPVDRPTLLIDIGGGSTEFTISFQDKVLLSESLPIGAVRFAYGSDHDPKLPYSDEDYAEIRKRTRGALSECAGRIIKIGFERVIGCSGSFKTIKRILDLRGLPLNASSVHIMVSEVRSLSLEERLSVPGLGTKRADIMPAGATIAEIIMEELDITDFDVSQKGLKDGMFIKYRLENL